MKDEPAQKDGRGRGDDDAGVAEDRQAVYPRLERRRTERILGGVASGLADHFGLDPVLFRLGFVVLALFGGSGVLLYVLGWLFLPEEGAGEPAVVAATRDIGVRKLAALALFAIALLFLGGPVWMPLVQADYLDASLLWSLVLVALGFLLLRGDPPPRQPPSRRHRHPRRLPARVSRSAPPPPSCRCAERPSRRVSRRRSPLGWISLGAMLLVVGGAAVLDNLGVVELGLKDLLAAAVITLGSGLIAGAFWGRARWLIPVGIILMPGLILASVIELPLRGSIGGRSLQPRSAVELSQGYRVLAGDLWLHLENFDFNEGESITVPVDMVAGTLSIYVPRGVAVDIDGHIGAGGSDFPGRRDQGFELKLDESLGGSNLKRHLVLQVDAGVGFVSVYRNRLVKDLRAAAQAKGSEKKEENKKTQSTPKRSQNDKQGAG